MQEAITDIETQRIGGELGIEAQVTPTIKLKGAASVGQYIYNNNPNLTYYSQVKQFLVMVQQTLKTYM